AVKPKDALRAANAPEEVQADSRNTAQGFKNNQNKGLSQRNPPKIAPAQATVQSSTVISNSS
ncbi:MAG: hypothetical protein WA430_14750, partial [Acidobacteriaceae bacterium]